MFARGTDGGLASFVGRLEKFVVENEKKKACATVVLLAKKEDVQAKLEAIAQDGKIAHVPLTVAKEAAGPEDYHLPKDAFTVVVYDKDMDVTAVLSFEKLDAKAQDAVMAAFEKVLAAPAAK